MHDADKGMMMFVCGESGVKWDSCCISRVLCRHTIYLTLRAACELRVASTIRGLRDGSGDGILKAWGNVRDLRLHCFRVLVEYIVQLKRIGRGAPTSYASDRVHTKLKQRPWQCPDPSRTITISIFHHSFNYMMLFKFELSSKKSEGYDPARNALTKNAIVYDLRPEESWRVRERR